MIQKTHYIKVDLNSNHISKILKNYGIQQGNKTTKSVRKIWTCISQKKYFNKSLVMINFLYRMTTVKKNYKIKCWQGYSANGMFTHCFSSYKIVHIKFRKLYDVL